MRGVVMLNYEYKDAIENGARNYHRLQSDGSS